MSEGINLPASWIGAAVGGIPVVAGLVKWWIVRRDRRRSDFYQRNKEWAERLEAREKDFNARLAGHVRQCEADLRAVCDQMAQIARRCERAELGLALLARETLERNPQSLALQQVKALLARDFPIDLNTPPDMTELLARMDERIPS